MQSRTSEDTLIHNLIREADKRNMLFAKYKSYWIHRETGHSKIRAAREKRRRSQSPATRQGWKRFKRLSKTSIAARATNHAGRLLKVIPEEEKSDVRETVREMSRTANKILILGTILILAILALLIYAGVLAFPHR